ncbi:MAG: LamG domain-containing protein [Pseudomonadales bacterium]|nr:LamG domain-containing protein [Pseudomonadales bacterium]
MKHRSRGAFSGVLVPCLVSALFGVSLAGAAPGGDDGLVALWQFEEGSGITARDSSRNRNDGVIVGTGAQKSLWGTGEFAGSVSLSGSPDQHIRIPASPSLNDDGLKKHLTVIADIFPRSLWAPRRAWAFWESEPAKSGYIAIVQRQWRETIHPDLFYLGFGPKKNVLNYKWHVGAASDDDASLYRLPQGQPMPSVNQWIHLAGTYDGDTGMMALYVNGELLGTRKTSPGEIRLDPESMNRPLVIGAEVNGSDIDDSVGEFDGYIDEVRIYARTLAADEIKALAKAAHQREAE